MTFLSSLLVDAIKKKRNSPSGKFLGRVLFVGTYLLSGLIRSGHFQDLIKSDFICSRKIISYLVRILHNGRIQINLFKTSVSEDDKSHKSRGKCALAYASD